MKNLFLDDVRVPKLYYPESANDWDMVNSYNDFKEYFDNISRSNSFDKMPKIVSFDFVLNDLMTGMDCASYLADFCLQHNIPLPQINTHSNYPDAVRCIRDGLRKWEKRNGVVYVKKVQLSITNKHQTKN